MNKTLQLHNLKQARNHMEIQETIHTMNGEGFKTTELPEKAFPAWYVLGCLSERDFDSHVILYYDKGLKVIR